MSNGKGDTQRPKQITDAEYARNWEHTFGTPPVPRICERCGYLMSREVCTKCMWH